MRQPIRTRVIILIARPRQFPSTSHKCYCVVNFFVLFVLFFSSLYLILSSVSWKYCCTVKMEDEISCDDPQFMTMLETCLLMEIETCKNTFSGIFSFLLLSYFRFLLKIILYLHINRRYTRDLSIYSLLEQWKNLLKLNIETAKIGNSNNYSNITQLEYFLWN